MGYINIVETQEGKSAELSCHTGTLPLQYCRFISPSGVAYHLQSGRNTDGVEYWGRGLGHGDCGIRIHSVQRQDMGGWTCVLRVGKDYRNEESSADILLFQAPSFFSEVNLAPTLGISFGVLVVLCGLIGGFFVYRRWKKRRRDLNDSDERITFQRSSNEVIFNTSASDYNATTQGGSNLQIQSEAAGPSAYRRGKKQKRNRGRNEEGGASSGGASSPPTL